ncbi:hypothetical protein PHYSODRAFT_540605 [Phytophthora sojae]|uniref:Uncharacterized protein n=1 Tax=Phytophthora sojae (strain P6497) TaxID=1094619 RepID=G4YTE4_PHYSP|nr:hypothetical protein PHYSODRAFT_540605 [Phytophthora sojae]EGZ23066.1 hypothetical protein PHYSODRAFT_540605 [Phytophthora sojae]|eukprot:XP_009518354.1 hypothetical protein PHYSODRAFT_540605 [Phytophthora sojae]
MSGGNPFAEEETPVVQTVDVVADNGEQQQVILVGGIEDGTQTIEVLNDFGGYTETEVKAIETPEGEKLVVPDAEGDMTVVTVPEVPAEIAEIATEDTQVVNVVTPSGEQQQVVIEGEPEHGEVTIELVDEHGEVTTEEVKAVETDEGIKLVVPTDDGYVPVVVPKIPEEIQQEIVEEQPTMSGGNPFAEEETPVVQTVDVVADNGEQQQVILVGGIEDGTQTIEVLNDFGGYTETEVKAIETPEGEKLVVPDAEGDMTVVTVPEVPAEIAEIATEDTQVVNVVTPSGEQQQVVIEGEPEHGEVTIELVDEHGEVTTEEVKAVETDEGIKLVVPTDDGYVPVVVPKIPEEIQQQIMEEASEESKFMTKDEFREWIARRYEDQLSELKKQEQRLKQEEAATTGRVKQLKDCIEQAANKFGYYGVYEQAPHYQNAVEWVENDCWANQWEPESPAEHPMLRR